VNNNLSILTKFNKLKLWRKDDSITNHIRDDSAFRNFVEIKKIELCIFDSFVADFGFSDLDSW
jgi:hypothetical protein